MASYDVSTDEGKLRLKISDVGGTSGNDFIFEDNEIEAFLEMASGSIALGAAAALRAIASNEAQVSKRIKFLELSTDGPAVAKELRELADKYEEEAEESGSDEDWDPVVEMITNSFGEREARGL
jgi:hypothetical protein